MIAGEHCIKNYHFFLLIQNIIHIKTVAAIYLVKKPSQEKLSHLNCDDNHLGNEKVKYYTKFKCKGKFVCGMCSGKT